MNLVEPISYGEMKKREYIRRATSRGNATLNKRTQPDARSLVTLLGYNTVVTCLSQSNGNCPFSGGTYNRYDNKIRKNELAEINQKQKEIARKNRQNNCELSESGSEIPVLCTTPVIKSRHKRGFSNAPFKRGESLHFLSLRSKGKIRDKAMALSRCLGQKQTFLTLTFINDVADSVAIGILNKFFNTLRKELGQLQYFWVAERQLETTDRIHFHIIINKFLPVRRFNALWVLQQYNSGIEFPGISIEEVRAMIAIDEEDPKRKSELQKKLNPFTVKKITHIYGLSYYLTKYVTKNRNEGFGCSAWHCTRGVSRLFTKSTVSRSCLSEAGTSINARLDKKTGELVRPKIVVQQFHQLYYINNRVHFLPYLFEMEEVNSMIIKGEIDFELIRRALN